MITKDSVFAQAGQQDPTKTSADFRQGMVPNTLAKAEDVNTYGNWSDKDLKVVCDEIVNALKSQGINPNNSYTAGSSNQLAELLQTKLRGAYALTGIDYTSYTQAPTQSTDGKSITFRAFDIVFNTAVYYGNTQAQQARVTLTARTITANSTWANGVHYLYATRQGGIAHQQTPVLGSEGAQKCMLGSVFVINGAFQINSWKFQPWLQTTAMERRESPTAYRKGGFVSAYSATEIQMGALEIMAEGINFATDTTKPNILSIQAQKPFSFKLLYPAYNPSDPQVSDLTNASTHIYNITTGNWQEIPADYYGKFICLVPCIVPTGQTLMVPAFTTQTGTKLDNIYDTVEAASNAVFGLQYSLASVAERAIYLGQTLIIKVGTTDITNPNNFATVGLIPEALAGFTSASGQTGGGSGEYVPMRARTWPATPAYGTMENNAVNIITGSTEAAWQVSLPSAVSSIVNQLEIHYTHASTMKGLVFPSSLKWWGSDPIWTDGWTYNIIVEYIDGVWRAGYLVMPNN